MLDILIYVLTVTELWLRQKYGKFEYRDTRERLIHSAQQNRDR